MKATQYRANDEGDDYRVNVDNRGHLTVIENWRASEDLFDDIDRPVIRDDLAEIRRDHMRELKGDLPSAADLNQVKMEIHFLNNKESMLAPQERFEFHDQMHSAENQLRLIRAELSNPILRVSHPPLDLRKQITRDWRKLNATLIRAEAFYD